MTVEELIDTIAAKTAGEIIVELYGSSFYQLPAADQAQYLAEIVLHIRAWLHAELEAALTVIRVDQPPPGQWQADRAFDRIVAQFKETTP